MRRLARKGNLTIKVIFDLEKEDQVFTWAVRKCQEARDANQIDSAVIDATEIPYARHVEI